MGVGVSLVVHYVPRDYFRSLPRATEVIRGIWVKSLARFVFGLSFESLNGMELFIFIWSILFQSQIAEILQFSDVKQVEYDGTVSHIYCV